MRDVPLHMHMVKSLPKGEQMALLHQLARDNKVQLKEKPEDTVGMQEDIPDTQGGDPIEGQGSGEEISVDKDCPLGIEFPFDEELFEKPRKLRAHLTRAEKRRHNQQWTRSDGSTATAQLKTELTGKLGDLNERLREQGGATTAQIELRRERESELAQIQ